MKTYYVSQSELWHRRYIIEAKSKNEALAIYNATPNPDDTFLTTDPEYLMDLDDIEVTPAP